MDDLVNNIDPRKEVDQTIEAMQANTVKEILVEEEIKETSGGVHACQLVNNEVINISATILVPEGYTRIPDQPVNWWVTVNRSNLKVVYNEITVPGTVYVNHGLEMIDTMIKLYEVSVVGTLNYNVVKGCFETQSSAYSNTRTAFSDFGFVPLNYVAGYVTNPNEICEDIVANLVFGITEENPSLVKDGVITVYDPNNPEAYYSVFDGSDDITFNLVFEVTVTSTPTIS